MDNFVPAMMYAVWGLCPHRLDPLLQQCMRMDVVSHTMHAATNQVTIKHIIHHIWASSPYKCLRQCLNDIESQLTQGINWYLYSANAA